MRIKKIVVAFLVMFCFLTTSFVSSDIIHALKGGGNIYSSAYAKPKSSSGGFKSGVFKSSGSVKSGGFKSGSFKSKNSSGSSKSSGGFSTGGFFNTKKSSGSSGSGSQYKRSFFPIPIPIPWGIHHNYGYNGLGTSLVSTALYSIFGIIKFIVIVAIIIFIIRRLNRRR